MLSRKTLIIGLLAGALIPAAFQSYAEVQALPAKASTVKNSTQAQVLDTGINSKPLKTSNLRCWQEGRLLFEKTHLSEKAMKSDPMLQFNDDSRDEPSQLYMFEMGTATCLFEKVST